MAGKNRKNNGWESIASQTISIIIHSIGIERIHREKTRGRWWWLQFLPYWYRSILLRPLSGYVWHTKRRIHPIGTPRQPGITPLSKGRIELSPYISYEAFDDLCTFSHIWILFVFHLNTNLNVLEKSKNDHGWTFPVFFFISYCDVTGKNKASKTEGQENGSLCHQNVSP